MLSRDVGFLKTFPVKDETTVEFEVHLIHCIACQEVTSQTSSIYVMVSRNSSKPSLWWGVVNQAGW